MSSSVTIINTVSMQSTYTALGLGQIPSGTLADAAMKTIQQALLKKVQASWPKTAAPFDTTQSNSGLMGPWSANVGGTAPPCAVRWITSSFNDWGLPNDQQTVASIAQEITTGIQANGGLSGQFFGKTRVGGSETIYWAVGFGTGAIVDNPEEMGIIFVYTAVLGLNSARS